MLADNVGKTAVLLALHVVASLFSAAECGSNATAAASPWVKKNGGWPPEDPRGGGGCWRRPWTCNGAGVWPPRKMCCRNVCVDVVSDSGNCGFCGRRCPFTWRCCGGMCSNTNLSPFNCGHCGNTCPFGVPCFYGMCGYAQPFPPRPPFPPFPPRPPFPPFPPRPPFPPFPPRPPFPPFPPRPPMPPPKPPKPPGPPMPPLKPPKKPGPPVGDQ